MITSVFFLNEEKIALLCIIGTYLVLFVHEVDCSRWANLITCEKSRLNKQKLEIYLRCASNFKLDVQVYKKSACVCVFSTYKTGKKAA